jgi:hypothetical protein
MKNKNDLKLGYDITIEKGTCRPTKVQLWSKESHAEKFKAEAPFKYMADALVGLSLIKINSFVKSPILMPHINYNFATEAWAALDPHHQIFERSFDRVNSLGVRPNKEQLELCEKFESAFNNAFESAQKPWGMDLRELSSVLDTISWFEEKMQSPVLYNFSVQWSRPFREKLLTFYSFLYNLRSIVAVDLNAHIEDPSHEAVKVDSITDYLQKAEYVVNDALLYCQFKKLTTPFTSHRKYVNGELPVYSLMIEPMYKAFKKYSHNAVNLINNLPPRFIGGMNNVELEEALYMVQMDWLLGSDAGLLFRIREELFGVQNGYENLFWQDLEITSNKKTHSLSLCCEIKESMIYSAKAA